MPNTKLYRKTKKVVITDKEQTVVIGERINGTGSKNIRLALENDDTDAIANEAKLQVDHGADIIDINAGSAIGDEVDILPKIVKIVMNAVDAPLCFDSSNPKAIEAALKIYDGKGLINSVTGEKTSLETILPLAKKYNAGLIALVIDDNGISDDPDTRVDIACKIVEQADAVGISVDDIIVDCLVQSIGIDNRTAISTLETIEKVKRKLPVMTTVGLSNCSFGLPARENINSAFLSMAISAGLNCVIADPSKIMSTLKAADLLKGKDNYAKQYVKFYNKGW